MTPGSTILASSSTSQFVKRIQPCEPISPTSSGSAVPWIPEVGWLRSIPTVRTGPLGLLGSCRIPLRWRIVGGDRRWIDGAERSVFCEGKNLADFAVNLDALDFAAFCNAGHHNGNRFARSEGRRRRQCFEKAYVRVERLASFSTMLV